MVLNTKSNICYVVMTFVVIQFGIEYKIQYLLLVMILVVIQFGAEYKIQYMLCGNDIGSYTIWYPISVILQ